MADTRASLDTLVPINQTAVERETSGLNFQSDISGLDLTRNEEIRRMPDPQFGFRFLVELPFNFPPVYVESVTMNASQIDSIPHHHSNTKRYYPGFNDIAPITLMFYYDMFAYAKRFNLEWQALVHNPNTGHYGLPARYKRNILVHHEDQTGRRHATTTFYGAWPTGLATYEFIGDAADRLRLVATYSVDGFYMDYEEEGNDFLFSGTDGIRAIESQY